MVEHLVRNLLKNAALWLIPVSFLVAFFFWPSGSIIGLGLGHAFADQSTSTNATSESVTAMFTRVFADPDVLSALWFTIWQATISTIATLAIALPAAYVLYRKSIKGSQFYRAVITIPLVLPTIVVAIIFSSFQKAHEMYSDFGMSFWFENKIYWILVAHVFINFAIAVRTIGSMWAGLDRGPEESAAMAGAGRLRIFWSVSAPMLRPSIVSAAALVFLFCFTSFGVIVVLGGGQVATLETQISIAALQFLDLQKASILALAQTAITLLSFAICQRFARGSTGLDQLTESESQTQKVDKRDRAALLVTLIFIYGVILIPIALLLARAFETPSGIGLSNFANLASQGERNLLNISVWQAALNSLRNLFVALSIVVPIGLAVSFLTSRRAKSKFARAVMSVFDSAFMLPMGVSSVVLGLGFLITFSAEPLPLRSSWLVLPLVQALIALPLVIRVLQPALLAIETEQIESARTSGASSWQIWWQLEVPLIIPAIKTAVVFAILVSIGEFGAATLLVAGDQATLSTVLAQLISRPGGTNYGMAMSMSAMLVAGTAALVGLAQLKLNTRGRKAL